MTANKYQERTYRKKVNTDRFKSFIVSYFETDLCISVDKLSCSDLLEKFVLERIKYYRNKIESCANDYKAFYSSLSPIENIKCNADIISEMIRASEKTDTGPMASVAGAFSEFIGNDLLNEFHINEVIIENGGDIFLKINSPVSVSIFAGNSVLSEKVALRIPANETPVGICTSSGTVGHSFSFGKADAVVIACKNTLLADAYATKFANLIKDKSDINRIIEQIQLITDIISAVIIKDDNIGIWGHFKLIALNE